MMSESYAIIETGGKQYQVREGDVIQVERVVKNPGDEVSFDRVLLVSKEGEIKVGDPILKDAKVLGKFLKEIKGEKVIAFKYKRRKNYRRKVGHRQKYSLVKIESLQVG